MTLAKQRIWHIWVDEWAATGERGGKIFAASVRATTFRAACRKHYAGDLDYNVRHNTYWGIRLYSGRAPEWAS